MFASLSQSAIVPALLCIHRVIKALMLGGEIALGWPRSKEHGALRPVAIVPLQIIPDYCLRRMKGSQLPLTRAQIQPKTETNRKNAYATFEKPITDISHVKPMY